MSPDPQQAPSRRSEAGFSLAGLVATIVVMLILMGAAVPSWNYVMKDAREEELIFRGGEIADAIARFQKKNGNALPPSLEALVQGKYLRRLYKEPMTRDGKWRFIRQGEIVGAGGAPAPGAPSPSPAATPSTRPGVPTGQTVGAIIGVASTSTDKSLRIFNGRTRYNEWLFMAGQPRVVGRHPTTPAAGAPRPGAPGTAPGQLPGQPPRQ